jgi:hypothetical protein
VERCRHRPRRPEFQSEILTIGVGSTQDAHFPGLNRREQPVNAEDPIRRERRRANDEPVFRGAILEDRPRDSRGHCWDGRPCDQPAHGAYRPDYGTIHIFY